MIKNLQKDGAEEVVGEQAMNSIHLPYKHIAMKSRKNLRNKLMKGFIHWFKLESENQEILSEEIIETMQNAVILLDDILDSSLVRRGLPCAQIVYGIPNTLNSGIYYIFDALQQMLENAPKDQVYELMTEMFDLMMDEFRGQQMDIYWREYLIVPTLEEYKKMVDLKTTTMFRLIYRMLKKTTDSDLNLDRFLYLFGQFFQIRDDYISLTDKEYHKTKGFADDLTEGKFSFPIIHGIRRDPKDSTILSILKMHTDNVELKQMVINKLEELGSFKYTKSYLDKLELELLAELAKFPDNPFFQEMLKPILFNCII